MSYIEELFSLKGRRIVVTGGGDLSCKYGSHTTITSLAISVSLADISIEIIAHSSIGNCHRNCACGFKMISLFNGNVIISCKSTGNNYGCISPCCGSITLGYIRYNIRNRTIR